jgi:hypothetical protein
VAIEFTLSEKTMPFHRTVLVSAACLTLLISTSFASAGDGKIAGRITIDGKPLVAGRIFFHLDDGQFVGAKVKDGKYVVNRVPAGTRKVTVEGMGVPAQYASEDTSGLTLVVKDGKATHDIVLR